MNNKKITCGVFLIFLAGSAMAEDSQWIYVTSDKTRIVHIKSIRADRPLIRYFLKYISPPSPPFEVETNCGALTSKTLIQNKPSSNLRFAAEEITSICSWVEAQWQMMPTIEYTALVPTPSPGPAQESVWVTMSSDASRQVDANSLQINRPIVRYLIRNLDSLGSASKSFSADVNCEDLERREPKKDNRSNLKWVQSSEEINVVCGWAEERWKSTTSIEKENPRYPSSAPKASIPKPSESNATSPTVPPPPAQNRSTGSGFLIGPQLIITNHHVVEGCKSLKVRRDSAIFAATIRASTVRNDLAALSIDRPLGISAVLRSSALLGEDVVAAGHPQGDCTKLS